MRTTTAFAHPPGPSTLLRRKACEACRRRKLKCDGRRPYCSQCQRSKIEDDCEYKDGSHKSRTKTLLEQISKLESHLEYLEKRRETSTQQWHSTPDLTRSPTQSSSTSSEGSCDPPSPSEPFPELFPIFDVNDFLNDFSNDTSWMSEANNIPGDQYKDLLSGSASQYTFIPSNEFAPCNKTGMDSDIVRELLEIFMPHRCQVGLRLTEMQLRRALMNDNTSQTTLLNVICLWGCHFSVSPKHKVLEPQLVSACVRSLSFSLQFTDADLVDVIRATCLVSLYFTTKGRLLEGRYHASAAVALASQIHSPQLKSSMPRRLSLSLDEDDDAPLDYRSQAFWQVFYLDRCWSSALGMPHSLREPLSMKYCRSIHHDTNLFKLPAMDSSRSPFVLDEPYQDEDESGSHAALRASALFGHAYSFVTRWSSGEDLILDPKCREEFMTLNASLCRLTTHTPSLSTIAADLQSRTEIGLEWILTQTLTASSTIMIRMGLLRSDPNCIRECIETFARMVEVIRLIEDDLYQFLDPICGMCWVSTTRLLLRCGVDLEQLSPEPACLETVLRAVAKLEIVFPVVGKLT